MQARNDGGPSNSATVTVEVLDVNDVTPRFTQEIYNAAIVENRPAGASVVMVTATDDDEGANGMVRYSLIGGDIGVFQHRHSLVLRLDLRAFTLHCESKVLMVPTKVLAANQRKWSTHSA